jgi:hypothetical protein
MSNGAQNCALEICCPPLADGTPSEKAVDALMKELIHEGLSAEYAKTCAPVMLKLFDLAPRGTLQKFKAITAKLALEQT